MNRFAFISPSIDVVDVNKRNKNVWTHTVCKELVGTNLVVIYFSKNFYLIDAINQKLKAFATNGLLQHIIDDYVDMRYLQVKEIPKGPQTLTIDHLRGAFSVWMTCCLVCCAIFVIEVLVKSMIRWCATVAGLLKRLGMMQRSG